MYSNVIIYTGRILPILFGWYTIPPFVYSLTFVDLPTPILLVVCHGLLKDPPEVLLLRSVYYLHLSSRRGPGAVVGFDVRVCADPFFPPTTTHFWGPNVSPHRGLVSKTRTEGRLWCPMEGRSGTSLEGCEHRRREVRGKEGRRTTVSARHFGSRTLSVNRSFVSNLVTVHHRQ